MNVRNAAPGRWPGEQSRPYSTVGVGQMVGAGTKSEKCKCEPLWLHIRVPCHQPSGPGILGMNRAPGWTFLEDSQKCSGSPPAHPPPKLKLTSPLNPGLAGTPKPCNPSMVGKLTDKRYLGDLNPTGSLTFPRHRAAWGLTVSLKPPALCGIISAEQVTPNYSKRD